MSWKSFSAQIPLPKICPDLSEVRFQFFHFYRIFLQQAHHGVGRVLQDELLVEQVGDLGIRHLREDIRMDQHTDELQEEEGVFDDQLLFFFVALLEEEVFDQDG